MPPPDFINFDENLMKTRFPHTLFRKKLQEVVLAVLSGPSFKACVVSSYQQSVLCLKRITHKERKDERSYDSQYTKTKLEQQVEAVLTCC